MKKTIKTIISFSLVLAILASSFVCFAYELNQDAVNLHRGQYKKYVLLGDSVASGYRDVITENENLYNEAYQQTTYCRVPGSYADILTKAIIEDNTMTAFAAPGFRTIEIRYMLEDDFDECDDYMFHPAQLETVGDAGSEEFRTAYKKAVAEADLITLGVGGNDWGAYIGWVVSDVFEKENVADKYVKMLQDYLANNSVDMSSIEDLVEIAHIAGALPELATAIPSAIEYGLGTFYKNWDIMIQDIYDLNPDVTIMAVGMSDNSVKGRYFSYDGVEGEKVNGDEEPNEAVAKLTSVIVELIMTIANKPMVDGADKFGYIFVDTKGTTYVDSHPDEDGHAYIADKIIEALPHPDFSVKYDDVKIGQQYYSACEFVLMNGIMTGTSATTFSPDKALTKGELAKALNVINGTNNDTSDTTEVTALDFALSLLNNGTKKSLSDMIKILSVSFTVLSDKELDCEATITRGEAATYFKMLCE